MFQGKGKFDYFVNKVLFFLFLFLSIDTWLLKNYQRQSNWPVSYVFFQCRLLFIMLVNVENLAMQTTPLWCGIQIYLILRTQLKSFNIHCQNMVKTLL